MFIHRDQRTESRERERGRTGNCICHISDGDLRTGGVGYGDKWPKPPNVEKASTCTELYQYRL